MAAVNGILTAGTFGLTGSASGVVFRADMQGSGRFGFKGSVAGRLRESSVGSSATGSFGISGRARGHVGPALAATVWEWVTVAADPYVLQTARIRLATRDGEYGIIDPAEIMSLDTEENDQGGLESISLTISRDARLQFGDLDFLTDCELDYLGVQYHGRLEEQGIDLDSTMSRPLVFKGPLVRLKDHRAYRKCYVDSDGQTWATGQGPQAESNVFVVGQDG